MYLGMKALLKKHGANGITVNCLGGFYGNHIHAYPCLGFHELLNEGLVGGCECDLRSAATMVTMTALGQGGHSDHRGRRPQVALAGPDQALVEQFMEAQARIGVDVVAVEAAEAVDGDPVGSVLLEQILHAQVHRGGLLERFRARRLRPWLRSSASGRRSPST